MTTAPVTGIVDLHHHLLPQVDDGATDPATAVELARVAASEGIATIVCTPHTLDGVHDVPRERAREAFARLRDDCAAAGIAIELRLAAEVRMHESIAGVLAASPDVSLDGAGRYLLLELPHQSIPSTLPQFLFALRARGTTPVIAHPERNLAVRGDPSLAAAWVASGALLQLTAGSLDGTFGKPIEACALTLLRAGIVHVIATDAHSLQRRPPRIQPALRVAASIVGDDGARRLAVENPRGIVDGVPRDAIRPAEVVRRRWLPWRRA